MMAAAWVIITMMTIAYIVKLASASTATTVKPSFSHIETIGIGNVEDSSSSLSYANNEKDKLESLHYHDAKKEIADDIPNDDALISDAAGETSSETSDLSSTDSKRRNNDDDGSEADDDTMKPSAEKDSVEVDKTSAGDVDEASKDGMGSTSATLNKTNALDLDHSINVTASNDTADDGGDISEGEISTSLSNDTINNETASLPSSIPSTASATTPPVVFVDPTEFETDDKDLECPYARKVGGIAPSSSASRPLCNELPAACLNCSYDYTCTYGANVTVTCVPNVECEGDSEKTIEINMTCQYCFQTNFGPEHVCTLRNGPDSNCHVKKSPTSQSRFKTNCTVKPHVHCLGRRTFHKMLPCNWTSGYRWTTSLLLSIFLGGFGADRFYLGQWREGIGKLFSFGGLGVWTVIDVILISIGYIGPQDGSLYIY